ncbi:MAG TPA: hypothetical protein VGL71_12540, partial [Urbifossiella sp.]
MSSPSPETNSSTKPGKPSASRWPRLGQRVDVLLLAATAAFAFLAASFTATNSDLWLHLASGRLIAAGGYTFGVDPFSYTTGGIYWANHAWLFDLILYGVYQNAGGIAVVVLKALGAAALAGVMLRMSLRSGGPVWLAVGCTLVAILAMSPRLLVQPQCLSLLMLALCLHLLQTGGRALRWVPVLIASWVNLDGWFFLGPLLAVLFAIGNGTLAYAAKNTTLARAAGYRSPSWFLPSCLFACLLSPHHIHAFTLPPELSPAVWSSEFRDDPRFAGFFATPWRLASFGRTGGFSLAAWAFPVLLIAGLISFVINRRALRSWRSLVWLSFALLGIWQARLVPFFAVVAGPILAMNLGERFAEGGDRRAGRLAMLFASVTLLVFTWPGWLQGFHVRDRAWAWDIAPDSSLVRAAQSIREWRESSALAPEARTFTTHPEAAHHFAWFAPGERTFLDSRLQLFTGVAAENRTVGRSLGLIADRDDSSEGERILLDRRVGLLVIYDPASLGQALRTIVEHADRWQLARIDGAALEMQLKPAAFPLLPAFNAERTAFAPSWLTGFPEAPFAGPASLAEPARWWDLASLRQARHSWEADAAPVFLNLFEVQKQGTAPSSALPLLAIRAARMGIALHPRSDEAWVALARAYLHLGRSTWEAEAGIQFTLRHSLHHIQIAGALQQAATINPDSIAAHDLLARTFGEQRFLDLELHHRRESLRLAKRTGPLPGETPADLDARLARLAEAADQLERAVQDNENRFLVHTHSLAGNPLERALIARNLGLANTALDTLLKSHPDLYGVEGVSLLVDLLLQTGRIAEARILLDREELRRNPDALKSHNIPGGTKNGRSWSYGLPAYHWYDFCQCAAAGQYERAEAALERLLARLAREERNGAAPLNALLAFQVIGEFGLSGNAIVRLQAQVKRGMILERIKQLRFVSAERADLHVLGGLLQLERGDPAAANA